ncbi:helix-turn-helix domain-containing protein [uncultured Demequina sp.]|mgnify:CR=1 FL=1|uniref:winged helix-turn-helix domain-containing protein n=1 Tax=uncultured Demequina sp. TaxID=693499 RepID=UPI0025CEF1B7|nr:helix-turn-helix domain-containing protein [uncultured Demequina sp.]
MHSSDRRVDATALKALAHPLRVDIIDNLAMGGPATASQLADRLGESSGATSYHLRQLARHGFIEEDAERGTARERWWRMVPGGLTLSPTDLRDDPGAHEAALLVTRQLSDQRARHVDAFLRRGEAEFGEAWVNASRLMTARTRLTQEELLEIGDRIEQVIMDVVGPLRDREDPDGARTVALQFNMFPVVGVDGPGPAADPASSLGDGGAK